MVTKEIAHATWVILVKTVEHVFRVLLVNTRQPQEMHCVLCVLQAHIQSKLVPVPMYVLGVLLTRIQITPALQKQTAHVTQGRLVQMEDHVSNVLQENTNWNMELVNAHYVE